MKNESKDDLLTKSTDKYESEYYYLHQVHKELDNIYDYSKTPDAGLSNNPRLFLRGSAGMGKTHMLCDIVKNSLAEGYPALMFFAGEDLSEKDDVWKQIIISLNLKSITSRTKLLKSLNDAGRKYTAPH